MSTCRLIEKCKATFLKNIGKVMNWLALKNIEYLDNLFIRLRQEYIGEVSEILAFKALNF